jgi:hypothetical protein
MSDVVRAVRIEVEYSDGVVERAVGDDAAEIWRAIQSSFTLQYIHGMTYNGPKLQRVAGTGADKS